MSNTGPDKCDFNVQVFNNCKVVRIVQNDEAGKFEDKLDIPFNCIDDVIDGLTKMKEHMK